MKVISSKIFQKRGRKTQKSGMLLCKFTLGPFCLILSFVFGGNRRKWMVQAGFWGL